MELSNNDRTYLEQAAQLTDLKHHPGWACYEREVLDEAIRTLKNMLFNEKLTDIGTVYGIRAALRAFYLVKNKPEEMINVAREIRQELGYLEPEPAKEMVNAESA